MEFLEAYDSIFSLSMGALRFILKIKLKTDNFCFWTKQWKNSNSSVWLLSSHFYCLICLFGGRCEIHLKVLFLSFHKFYLLSFMHFCTHFFAFNCIRFTAWSKKMKICLWPLITWFFHILPWSYFTYFSKFWQ